MDNKNTPNFLQAFFGSLFAFRDYPRFAQRSLGSAAAHLVLALVLVASLMSFAFATWFNQLVGPHLSDFAHQVPEIRVVDGRAQIDLPQPHTYEIEGEPVLVLDTTGPAEPHLEGREALIVITETDLVIKEQTGEVTFYKIADFGENFEISASQVQNWLQIAQSWTLPVVFLAVMGWFLFWKPLQVVLVAGVVTLVNGSRPSFGTHFRLACYAMLPALAWSLLVSVVSLMGTAVPFSGLVYWAVLGGVTYYAGSLIKSTPYHQ